MRKKSTDQEVLFDYNSLLIDTVDDISRRQGFESDSLADCTPMSTGLLMLDLLYGGGIRPAWYTHFGPEQSAKTTGALSIVAAALNKKIPLIALVDYEGSSGNSKPYIGNILRTMGCANSINEVFGQRDEQTGKWVIPPVVRYRAETRGEAFFDWLSEIERSLPDKKKIGNQWWLRFEKTKVNQAKVGEYADASMNKKYGDGLWIKAQDGNLQGIIVVDSYPAMNPTSADNEDGDNSIALQARMFSKQLPRVKGRLADKMLAVIGINQLRMAPMVRYGNPEVEPGGQAIRFASDCRTRFNPRVTGMPGWPKNWNTETKYEEEPSVEVKSGKDSYRYIEITTKKNKLWNPGRKGWLRIWVEDGNGDARGFDPFYDTVCYLFYTGQLYGRGRKSLYLKIDKYVPEPVAVKWELLKEWVFADRPRIKEICDSLKLPRPFSLRKLCFAQMEKGIGEKLYISASAGKSNDDEEDGEE